MAKKAEISLTFSWIYVAVIGAMIMIGAAFFLMNIQKEAKESFYVDAKKYVYNLMNQLNQIPNSEKSLNMQGADLELACDSFSIKQSERSAVTFPHEFIFSPDLIKSTLIGYSDFLEIPMKSVRLSYLTSPYMKYLFLDSMESNILVKFLPELISKDIISSYSGFSSKEQYKVRYVTFGDIPSVSELGSMASFKDGDLTLLKIEVIEDMDKFPDSYGKVKYYSKKRGEFESTGEVFFIDRASLIAAIYSESSDFYYCNFEKIYPRLKITFDIEKDRLAAISQFNNAKQCNYNTIIGLTDQMLSQLNDKPNGITLQKIYSLKEKIRIENRYLERISCPVQY